MTDASREAFDKWWNTERPVVEMSPIHWTIWQAAIAWATEAQCKSKIPESVLKTVQRILDEESAYISRPNRKVDERIALAVTFALDAMRPQPEPPADLVKRAYAFLELPRDHKKFGPVETLAAFAAEYAAERVKAAQIQEEAWEWSGHDLRRLAHERDDAVSRAEAAEQALADVRSALSAVDYASLPDDYPVVGIAHIRMQTLQERTLGGLAEIGRREAAEQALAEEREAYHASSARLARLGGILGRVRWTADRRPASDTETTEALTDLWGACFAAALDAAAIRAQKGGENA